MKKDKKNYNSFKKSFSSDNNNEKNDDKVLYKKEPNSNFEKNRNLIKKIKNNKSKKHKRIMLALKISIAAIILLVAFVTFSIFSRFNKKLNLNDIGLTKSDEEAEKQISNITNILLLGIDDNNVSDAIMIASVDKTHKKINLISIARDSLVKIEPKKKSSYKSKINEAYSNGGEETTLKAINKNFNLRIMDYITINFEGLGDIVDALGGLDLEISKKESNQIDGIINSTKILKKKHPQMLRGKFGNVHLNGSQSVAYARIRKVETLNGLRDDFGRNFRQRLVMQLVFNKAMNFDKSKIFSLISAFLPNMKTSLDLNTIKNLYQCIKGKNYQIAQTQIPTPPYTIDPDYSYNSKSTVFYDLNYAGKLINAIIYDNYDQQTFLKEYPPQIKNLTSSNNSNTTKSMSSNRASYKSNSKNVNSNHYTNKNETTNKNNLNKANKNSANYSNFDDRSFQNYDLKQDNNKNNQIKKDQNKTNTNNIKINNKTSNNYNNNKLNSNKNSNNSNNSNNSSNNSVKNDNSSNVSKIKNNNTNNSDNGSNSVNNQVIKNNDNNNAKKTN